MFSLFVNVNKSFMTKRILPKSFYQNPDVLSISTSLLGKVIVSKLHTHITSGIIVETEAYDGPFDKASHAYNNRRTDRTETMYSEGGVAYIYLCYGLHHLFNVVTGPKNVPQAVLIRAIEPLEGTSVMLNRRKHKQVSYKLSSGPGMLSTALGITKEWDGHLLTKAPIWIEDRGIKVPKKDIIASSRIGIDYAKEHRDLPWRFWIRDNPWVSKF